MLWKFIKSLSSICGMLHVRCNTWLCFVLCVGRLGLGNDNNYCSVQEVIFPPGHRPAAVCCGTDASIVVTKAGRVLATGNNKYVGMHTL